MIRMATGNDAEAMLEIYIPFILNSGITQETEVPSVEEFRARIESALTERPWLVYETENEIAGYAYAGRHRERKGYRWCIEPSVYVSDKHYKKGVANALYKALFDILKLQGYVNAYAVITLPNEKSVSFHEKFGFTYLTTYKKIGYKLGQWHDVGWWEFEIIPHHTPQSEPVKFSDLDASVVAAILSRASQLIKK